MRKLQHFFSGTLDVTVDTPFPPRLLNLSAQRGIGFCGISWHSSTCFSLTIPEHAKQEFMSLVDAQQGHCQVGRRRGLPLLLTRLSKRIGFLAGLCCAIFAVCVLSRFIFVVEITGNDTVSTAEIRTALERAGLDVGVYGSHLSLSQLTQTTLSYLDGISWMSINLYGTRAVVEVREITPAPDIPPTDGLYDIVSCGNGIIEVIEVHRGQAFVAVGDTVTEGQLLVSGSVELLPPLYSTEPSQWLSVASSAVVWARTWRELTAVIPLTAMVKDSADATVHSFGWNFFGHNGSFLSHSILFPTGYTKTKESHSLPHLEDVPVTFLTIEETPYHVSEVLLQREASISLLQERLLQQVQEVIGTEGCIVASDFELQEKDGLLWVTIQAECYEQIATQVEGRSRIPKELPPVPSP